ncbi:MAG: T9SS type B sorting domain-containing protein [Sphingobacteriales bacterium]|nr:MAG: T9SS type B sorting domain-containing protein [Sphingobacteriales bacterium]
MKGVYQNITLSMHNSLLKIFFLAVVFIAGAFPANASHIFGGDIVYRCQGNNIYEFTFTLYQDCLSGDQEAIRQDNPSYFSIFDAANYNLITSGSTGPFISSEIVPTGFSNDCINNMPNTCMLKTVFRFRVTLRPDNPNGFLFVYQRCCRNQTINNIYSPGVTGATFTSLIPPYSQSQCSNNSAVFNNDPPQIICMNNPFAFDFSATDIDGDSLSYELCEAYIGASPQSPLPGSPFPNSGPIPPPPYTPVSYIPPYNEGYPIPSNPAFYINPITGLLTGTPTAAGRYVFTVCAKEWRNGQVINTLSRDLQFVITNCSKSVVANIPSYNKDPEVYVARCDSNFTVHFDNTSTGGFRYFWNFGDPNTLGDTSDQVNPSYTYPDTGTYRVKLVVNRGTTCPDSIEKFVKIYPVFRTDFGIAGKLCKGEPIQFIDRSTATFPTINQWEWNFGDGTTSTEQNPVHRFTNNYEEYRVTLRSGSSKGCEDTAIQKIIIPRFIPFAGNDTIVIKGHTFNMNGSGGVQYRWTPATFLDNPTDPKSSVTFAQSGRYDYNLNVINENLCEGNDSVRITVAERAYFIVPSAFSPNGDGNNDVIRPISAGYPNLTFFRIYNRWGQQVFQMFSGDAGGWDGTYNGKMSDPGVYFWHARAYNLNGEEEDLKGDLTLIR